MEYVTIGKIINTHGIKGEMKVEIHSDFVSDRFAPGSTIYIGEERLAFKVGAYRLHQGFLLLSLEGMEDINLIEKYKGCMIYKDTADIPALPKGQFYFKDLKGLEVFQFSKKVGTVLYVEEGMRCNYLRIKTEKGEKPVPFLDPFIDSVSLEEKKIVLKEMEGLL